MNKTIGLFGVIMLLGQTSALYASPIYFVVAEQSGSEVHFDSYILPLSYPADIAHGRELIVSGPRIGGAIAVANIAAGSDGINRNYIDPDMPLWSWHVTEFVGFADVTAEILDGWPAFVESNIEGWISNTGGAIGFWSYTIVAEVPEPAPGDANFDGLVDVADLGIVGANFNANDMQWNTGDFNLNGTTDVADLGIVGANWSAAQGLSLSQALRSTGLTSVPEPATLTLLAMSVLMVGRRRR